MANERAKQMQDAARLMDAERAVAIQRTEQLQAAYKTGWENVHALMRTLEPVLHELIAREVRKFAPDAIAVWIEPTDQGGPYWTFGSVKLPDGSYDDRRHDSDALDSYLSDLGEFMSSEDHPAQDLLLPAKP